MDLFLNIVLVCSLAINIMLFANLCWVVNAASKRVSESELKTKLLQEYALEWEEWWAGMVNDWNELGMCGQLDELGEEIKNHEREMQVYKSLAINKGVGQEQVDKAIKAMEEVSQKDII